MKRAIAIVCVLLVIGTAVAEEAAAQRFGKGSSRGKSGFSGRSGGSSRSFGGGSSRSFGGGLSRSFGGSSRSFSGPTRSIGRSSQSFGGLSRSLGRSSRSFSSGPSISRSRSSQPSLPKVSSVLSNRSRSTSSLPRAPSSRSGIVSRGQSNGNRLMESLGNRTVQRPSSGRVNSSGPTGRGIARSNGGDSLRRSLTPGTRSPIQNELLPNIGQRGGPENRGSGTIGSQNNGPLNLGSRTRPSLPSRIENGLNLGTRTQSGGTRSLGGNANRLPGLSNRRQLTNGANQIQQVFGRSGGSTRNLLNNRTLNSRTLSRTERHGNLQNRLTLRSGLTSGRTAYVGGFSNFGRSNWGRDWWPNNSWGRSNFRYDRWHRGYRYPGSYWNDPWRRYSRWNSFQTTLWGINQLAWTFGYWGYSNPYCYGPAAGSVVYDYSQPILVNESPLYSAESGPVVSDAGDVPPTASDAGLAAFEASRESFRQGDYVAALSQIDEALVELPNDAVVHEFRGLALFSLERYDEAAAALYAVLAVGPGWDWSTLSGLYAEVQRYTQQLRSLEAYVRANPQSSPGHFVLAYHYLTCGHENAAANQLKEVLRITPGQKVATDMLTMLLGPDAVKEVDGAGPPLLPPPAGIDAPPLKPELIRGAWKATGPDDSTFELTLEQDGSFVWKYDRAGKSEQVKGVWALDGHTLAMEPDTGGTMLAELSSATSGGFTFRMAGATEDDAGLLFRPRE